MENNIELSQRLESWRDLFADPSPTLENRLKIREFQKNIPGELSKLCPRIAEVLSEYDQSQNTIPIIEELSRAITDLNWKRPLYTVPKPPTVGVTWSVGVIEDDPTFFKFLEQCGEQICPGQIEFSLLSHDDVDSSAITPHTDAILLDLYDGANYRGSSSLARLLADHPALPVIICTGDPHDYTAWEMVRMGAAGLLVKPTGRDLECAKDFINRLTELLALSFHRLTRVPFKPPYTPPGELAMGVELTSGTKSADPNLGFEDLSKLIGMLVPECRNFRILKRFDNGRSGSLVFAVKINKKNGPMIIKCKNDNSLATEFFKYRKYVKGTLENVSGRIEQPHVNLFSGQPDHGPAMWSAIAYTSAGHPMGGEPMSLLDLYQTKPEQATLSLRALLENVLTVWYWNEESESRILMPWKAIGPHLGPLHTVIASELLPYRALGARFGTGQATEIAGEITYITWNRKNPVIDSFDLELHSKKGPTGKKVRVKMGDPSLLLQAPPWPWLRVGRFLNVKGIDVPSSEPSLIKAVELMEWLTGKNQPSPFASAVHGDLNMGNIIVQQEFPLYPWLIDFSATGAGYPLFELVGLEVALVTKVMIMSTHRWTGLDVWARDMIIGNAPKGLDWFSTSIDAIRKLIFSLYFQHRLPDAEAHFIMARAIHLLACQKFPFPLSQQPKMDAYLNACVEAAEGLRKIPSVSTLPGPPPAAG